MLFGQIDYINCLPVTLPLLADLPEGLQLRLDNPGRLNRAYAQGELDIGAMSAHYFLESADFELLPGICIAGRGAVGSVFLFSSLPLEKLQGAHIALPEASATSINLLKILLLEQGIEPRFSVHRDPSPFLIQGQSQSLSSSQNYVEADAWLMLGDKALVARNYFEKNMSDLTCIDLGQWWFETTSLPMVFGVWAARKSYMRDNASDCSAVNDILIEALRSGLNERFPQVLAAAGERLPQLGKERLERYFLNELSYRFDEEHSRGLAHFASKCRRFNLI